MLNNKHKIKSQKHGATMPKLVSGFTIVELIVSLGLFVTVIFIAIGALMSTASVSKRTQSIRVVMDNLNFAIDGISRNLRMGSDYHCDSRIGLLTEPKDCATEGATSVAFRDVNGKTVVYRLSGKTIQKSENKGVTYLDMTAPEIEIDKMQFFIDGSIKGDDKQPRILIIMEGTAGYKDKERVTFNIQTTISQRQIDS